MSSEIRRMIAEHHGHHEAISAFCTEASSIIDQLLQRTERLEHEVCNLRARVAEWETGPR
jgi:hypothetical protein